jgi:hypothetical protein
MLKRIFPALCVLVLLGACATLQGGYDLPLQHPAELERGRRPLCTDCHEARGDKIAYGRFDHTVHFGDGHSQEARQGERVCAMCHQTSFCNDCHATRVELKPSDKNQSDTYRRMPHRGDYRSRHIIDGRIDPTSCFRCHGNPKTARTCASCHG